MEIAVDQQIATATHRTIIPMVAAYLAVIPTTVPVILVADRRLTRDRNKTRVDYNLAPLGRTRVVAELTTTTKTAQRVQAAATFSPRLPILPILCRHALPALPAQPIPLHLMEAVDGS
jgi:hypothetical protein